MKRGRVRSIFFLFLTLGFSHFLSGGTSAMAADLRVQVPVLQSHRGVLRFALYDQAAGFPGYEGRRAYLDVPVPEKGGGEAVFPDLAPGTYAVAVYHDENNNGEFDQGLFGFPLEGYGFSRNASGFLSAPSFSSAAVVLQAGGKTIQIRLSY